MVTAARGGRGQVGFALTLVSAMGVTMFMFYALAALSPQIVAELGFSRAQLGALSTVLFAVSGIGALFVGRLVDLVGGRRVLMALFVLSAVGTAAVGAARGYLQMLLAVAVVGIALAAANPATNQLVQLHAPPGRRGLLIGTKQSGVQIAAFAAGSVLPAAAVAFGWREVLTAAAILTLAWVVPASRTLPAPEPGRGSRSPDLQGPVRVGRLALYAACMGAAIAPVGAYLPLYAHEELGYSAVVAGLLPAVIGGVGILSRVLWGRYAERGSSVAGALAWLAIISIAAQLLILFAVMNAALVWIGAALFGASATSWSAVGMLAVIREAGPERAGRATGWLVLGFHTGLVTSPIAVGALVDRSGSYSAAWALLIVFVVAAAGIAGLWHRRSTATAATVRAG